ncbi:hypothetical protein BJ508DRAFT_304954 [Ascobolus immersus RN42]|uniref:Uncharacterized protein n=1 Tax=Ascobolus immersus RN42 TaxID=1160509 RepID=A0A3N4ICP0_ASCIM|nr:hypothetical protein BJ508DRAFT_304954 [Ascobolus immersus RN42]
MPGLRLSATLQAETTDGNAQSENGSVASLLRRFAFPNLVPIIPMDEAVDALTSTVDRFASPPSRVADSLPSDDWALEASVVLLHALNNLPAVEIAPGSEDEIYEGDQSAFMERLLRYMTPEDLSIEPSQLRLIYNPLADFTAAMRMIIRFARQIPRSITLSDGNPPLLGESAVAMYWGFYNQLACLLRLRAIHSLFEELPSAGHSTVT